MNWQDAVKMQKGDKEVRYTHLKVLCVCVRCVDIIGGVGEGFSRQKLNYKSLLMRGQTS